RNTAIPYSNAVGELLSRYVSLYANASYSYTNKYVLTVSARRDASNVFGVRANKLWNPLWSVGGAWNISKENWFPNQNFLNDVKLRVRSEEHTSELQSRENLVCRLLLEKKK